MQSQQEYVVANPCFGGIPFHRNSLAPQGFLTATDEYRNLYLTEME